MRPEEKFHVSRRMFAIIGDKIKLAPVGDKRGHAEWFSAEGWGPFDEIVRGYYLNPHLVAYKGPFEHWGCYQTIKPLLPKFVEALSLDPDTTILWYGAKQSNIGDVWEGKIYGGTIGEELNGN